MTNYSPSFTITIAGVDYTDLVLDNATITTGRPDIFASTLSGYANIELAITGTMPVLDIKNLINIKVTDSAANDVDLFTGEISAINKSVNRAGTNDLVLSLQIQAVGSLAKLVRNVAGLNSYPEELDGLRIERILQEALFIQWADVPNTLTWADVSPTQQWVDFGVQDIDIIDNGRYDILARPAETVNAFELASQTASDGLGYLYETVTGEIGYAGAERRTNTFGTKQIDLDAHLLNNTGIETRLSTADIANVIFLSYDDPEVEVLAINDQSVEDYGIIEQQIATALADENQADEQALRLVALRGTPKESFDLLNVNLVNSNLDDLTRDLLLGVSMDTLIKVSNLPTGLIIGDSFEGFVEGWTWILSQNSLELEAIVSNSIYSAFEVQWEDYNPTTQWQNLGNDLQWQDLAIG
jgi:hypothetical protein